MLVDEFFREKVEESGEWVGSISPCAHFKN